MKQDFMYSYHEDRTPFLVCNSLQVTISIFIKTWNYIEDGKIWHLSCGHGQLRKYSEVEVLWVVMPCSVKMRQQSPLKCWYPAPLHDVKTRQTSTW